LEVRRRVEAILAGHSAVIRSPERLRRVRAIQVLEQIGSPQARSVLETLATGAAAARDTQEAQASLKRLAQRSVVAP
jgi:hypothetical protein